MRFRVEGPQSVFCGRCAHPLPDETQSFCSTCGAAFSIYPPTNDFILIIEHQLNVINKKIKRKQIATLLTWATLCIVLFLSAASIFKENKLSKISSEREVEFYVNNVEGYPKVPEYINREAILVSLQSFEDHFGIKIKKWRFMQDQIPDEISPLLSSVQAKELENLSFWQSFYRKQLLPKWKLNPYQPLKIFITNMPLKAPDFMRMETRHLSSSRLVGGFASPSFVIISSYRMLTEIKENKPSLQSRYLGEFLIAHELGHALLGLPDYVSTLGNQEFGARGIASEYKLNYSNCLMHTDQGGGLTAWKALQERTLREEAKCAAYHEILQAHKLRHEAIELAHQRNFKEALRQMDLAISFLPTDNSLSWIKELWTQERKELSEF